MKVKYHVTPDDTLAIAIGAGILGTGGGGSTYIGRLTLNKEFQDRGGSVAIVDATDVPDDAFVCAIGGMGAPTVGVEKLFEGHEFVHAVRALEEHCGKPIDALVIGEIGGSNAIRPLITGLQMGIPVVDGDGMGRAFPELQMDTFFIDGLSASPMALADTHGNTVVFSHLDSPFRAEAYGRVLTIEMGGSAALAMPSMSGREMRDSIIPDTLTLAHNMGKYVLELRAKNAEPADAVAEMCNGKVLFRGKISDVFRRTTQGFARGRVSLVGFGDPNDVMQIDFQNENLIAYHNDEVVCTVPDLICIINLEDGEPIGTEALKYGLRVAVLGLPAPKELKTPRALEIIGPGAFGYDVPFQPLPGDLL